MDEQNNILLSYDRVLIFLRLSRIDLLQRSLEEDSSLLYKTFVTTNPNTKETMLEIASRTDKTNITFFLLDKIKCCQEFNEEAKVKSFNSAIVNGNKLLCQKFLELNINPWFYHNVESNPHINSPIQQCVRNLNFELLQMFYKKGTSLTKKDTENNNLLHALMAGVTLSSPYYFKKNKSLVLTIGKWLMDHNISWHETNKIGVSPKELCCYENIRNELSQYSHYIKAQKTHHIIDKKIDKKINKKRKTIKKKF